MSLENAKQKERVYTMIDELAENQRTIISLRKDNVESQKKRKEEKDQP